MDWAGAHYEVDFFKKCWFWGGPIFENYFVHEQGPRGRSGRENSGKILAAALSRRDFLKPGNEKVGVHEKCEKLL